MKIYVPSIRVKVEEDLKIDLLQVTADKMSLAPKEIRSLEIVKRSLDARRKEQFYFEYTVLVEVAASFENKQGYKGYVPLKKELIPPKKFKERPIIVGFGPAGMFAALMLIKHDVKPLIFERGKMIAERDKDTQEFTANKVLNTESNIQFGEGGAGAYSDGKLYSRIKDDRYVKEF